MSKELMTLNEKLEKALASGTAKFTFRKKDGTLRTAYGTNKQTIVPNFYSFKNAVTRVSTAVTRYFDLERGEFRSFIKANLVSVAA